MTGNYILAGICFFWAAIALVSRGAMFIMKEQYSIDTHRLGPTTFPCHSETLEELKQEVPERVRAEGELFELAEDNLERFSEEFMRLY